MKKSLQVIVTADSEAVLEKKKQWAEVGLVVHNANISLQTKAEDLKARLIAPTSIDQVTEAEGVLKEINGELNALIAERKVTTSRFDKVSEALMKHEKSVKESIPAFQNAIIKLKQEAEKIKNAERAKEEAIRKAKEDAIKFVNESFKKMQDLVAVRCQEAYEFALNNPKTKKSIEESKIASYIEKCKAKLTEKDFTLVKPDNISQENFDAAKLFVDMPEPKDLLAYWDKQMNVKFEFYTVALKNKEAAIQASQKAKEEADRLRAEELSQRNVAAELEAASMSSEVTIDNGIKDLKKKYEVDLEDTEQNAILIMTAFVTNFGQVKDGVRVTKWSNLSVSQMGAALAWLKNKDDRFEFGGIKFKLTDKL